MRNPGVSVGTMIWLKRRYGLDSSGFVIAITMAKDAPCAPLVNHLCPLMIQWSPSRSAVVRSIFGSEPATSGSVMEKQLRISPATNGRSQRAFCSSLP